MTISAGASASSSLQRPLSTARGTRLVAALPGELLLLPLRTSLSALPAGLGRLSSADDTSRLNVSITDMIDVARGLCGEDLDHPVSVVRPAGWEADALVGGSLGVVPVTLAAVVFAAQCDARWIASYCSSATGAWADLGLLAPEIASGL